VYVSDPNSTPKQTPVVVDYRLGTFTSFPLGEPVFSSSTMADIPSESGAVRPIAGTRLASLGRFGDAACWMREKTVRAKSRKFLAD
jgi:hypothetical protein